MKSHTLEIYSNLGHRVNRYSVAMFCINFGRVWIEGFGEERRGEGKTKERGGLARVIKG